jgi:hypothetical protein
MYGIGGRLGWDCIPEINYLDCICGSLDYATDICEPFIFSTTPHINEDVVDGSAVAYSSDIQDPALLFV